MAGRMISSRRWLIALIGVAVLATGLPVPAQEADDAARALDRIQRRTGAIERNFGLSPDRAERIGLEQRLRDAERHSRRFRGARRGFDRAEIRDMKGRLDRLDRMGAPAIVGDDRPRRAGSRLIDPAIPRVDLGLDALGDGQDRPRARTWGPTHRPAARRSAAARDGACATTE